MTLRRDDWLEGLSVGLIAGLLCILVYWFAGWDMETGLVLAAGVFVGNAIFHPLFKRNRSEM
jgi:hypothetical protein